MLSRVLLNGGRHHARQLMHRAQLFNGMSANRRFVSSYAFPHIEAAWKDPAKIELAKEFTKATTVQSYHPQREEGLRVQIPASTKIPHPTVKYGLGNTYGINNDAVDKIPFRCAEHALLMRTAIAIPRDPSPEVRAASQVIAKMLFQVLSGMDKQTFDSIFAVGSDKAECRSREVIEDQHLFMTFLARSEELPPQQLLRILEPALSAIGMMANAHGSNYCKIAKAKANGVDVGGLDDFMKDMMVPLAAFHVPYIKGAEGPFAQLKFQLYKEVVPISDNDLVTEAHFLECIHQDKSVIPKVPMLRSVVVTDGSNRSGMIHDHLNLPHFFDVSGTTGAVMQTVMGLLHMAGRQDLVSTPEQVEALGMVIAGCNFYKQGFHNFYEVLPALSWVIHNVMKDQPYKQRTPHELLNDVVAVLKRCVDNPNTKLSSLVVPALELVHDHSLVHLKAFVEHAKMAMEQQIQTPNGPTFGVQ